MIAPVRRSDAAEFVPASSNARAHELWLAAVPVRQEWLDHGLSTRPSDRPAVEAAITRLYARILRPRPRFEWVDSPYKARPLIAGLPTLDGLYRWIRDPLPPGKPPLASDLAMAVSQLRAGLSAAVVHPDPELTPARHGKARQLWPELPPAAAFAHGVPLGVVLHQGIRTALYQSLVSGVCQPVRSVLARPDPLPVCWYGQQDASWIAYYDALRRLGLADYRQDDGEHFEDWATLARSGGWWWPDEQVCVVVERPMAVQVEPVPGTVHPQLRLTQSGVVYRDGWNATPVG